MTVETGRGQYREVDDNLLAHVAHELLIIRTEWVDRMVGDATRDGAGLKPSTMRLSWNLLNPTLAKVIGIVAGETALTHAMVRPDVVDAEIVPADPPTEWLVTFGSAHSDVQLGEALAGPDGWLAVDAPDEWSARVRVASSIGPRWAFIYSREQFDRQYPEPRRSELFPRGELARWSA